MTDPACTMECLHTLAEALDHAQLQAKAIAPLSLQHSLTTNDAYRIQAASVARRLGRGERLAGVKMGFTSEAKMRQMGVSDQILGWLTGAMQIGDGGSTSLARYIHPRCEPEIAFLLKHALPAAASLAEACAAIAAVAPAIEIIDSRFEQFKFSLSDVIADNASSAGFAIGTWSACPADLCGLDVELQVNGEVRQSGSTSAILGNPLHALVAAARLAAQAGTPLQAGWIVLAGAATPSEALHAGVNVRATVNGVGTVGFSVQALA